MLRAFHGRFLEDETGYTFLPSSLKAAEIDLADQPDLGPILFVSALFAEGTSRFVNVRRLRYKECDRIEAMKSELKNSARKFQSEKTKSGSRDRKCIRRIRSSMPITTIGF